MRSTFQPRTKPTDQQRIQAKAELERLVSVFGRKGVESLCGRVNGAVGQWVLKGMISASAAHELCKLDVVKNEGFTREGLRPDVRVWYIDDLE